MDNMGDGGRALALIVFGPFVFLVLLALWGLVDALDLVAVPTAARRGARTAGRERRAKPQN